MKKYFFSFKWVFTQCKKFIPHITCIIFICSIRSLISVSIALCTKYLIDAAYNLNKALVNRWIILLGLSLLITILFTSIDSIFSTYCSEKIRNELQKNIYSHILRSTWLEHNKHHSMDFLTRINNDISSIVDMIVLTIPNIFSLSLLLCSSFFAIHFLSESLSLVAIFIFPLLIFISKIYGHKLHSYYISLQKCESSYNKFMQESFNNILIIKTFCIEKLKLNNFQNLQNERFNLNMKRSYLSCCTNGFFSLSSYTGFFIVLIWGAYSISTASAFAFGSLTALMQLFKNIQQPIYGLASAFPQFISALAASERVIELETMPCENYSFSKLLMPHSYNRNISITFKNVSFSYTKDTSILNNISFSIHSGDIVGLIGPSGQGKTTLIRLILGLLTPHSGEILINNEPLNIYHRNLISYVPQGNTLFSGSIMENISFLSSHYNKNEIIDALKLSEAYNFVTNLKNNLYTILGENSVGISEGQCQRLSIARGLLKKSPILILDEATSSLDETTELKVLKNIAALSYKPICLIITHRPAALKFCNKIFKLENSIFEINETVT